MALIRLENRPSALPPCHDTQFRPLRNPPTQKTNRFCISVFSGYCRNIPHPARGILVNERGSAALPPKLESVSRTNARAARRIAFSPDRLGERGACALCGSVSTDYAAAGSPASGGVAAFCGQVARAAIRRRDTSPRVTPRSEPRNRPCEG